MTELTSAQRNSFIRAIETAESDIKYSDENDSGTVASFIKVDRTTLQWLISAAEMVLSADT